MAGLVLFEWMDPRQRYDFPSRCSSPVGKGEPGWVTQVIQPDLLEDAPAHYRSAGLGGP